MKSIASEQEEEEENKSQTLKKFNLSRSLSPPLKIIVYNREKYYDLYPIA
jgi:hypothetical protein